METFWFYFTHIILWCFAILAWCGGMFFLIRGITINMASDREYNNGAYHTVYKNKTRGIQFIIAVAIYVIVTCAALGGWIAQYDADRTEAQRNALEGS
jgi:uncharacterized membrane protein